MVLTPCLQTIMATARVLDLDIKGYIQLSTLHNVCWQSWWYTYSTFAVGTKITSWHVLCVFYLAMCTYYTYAKFYVCLNNFPVQLSILYK